jgi:hypothetical protein
MTDIQNRGKTSTGAVLSKEGGRVDLRLLLFFLKKELFVTL